MGVWILVAPIMGKQIADQKICGITSAAFWLSQPQNEEPCRYHVTRTERCLLPSRVRAWMSAGSSNEKMIHSAFRNQDTMHQASKVLVKDPPLGIHCLKVGS